LYVTIFIVFVFILDFLFLCALSVCVFSLVFYYFFSLFSALVANKGVKKFSSLRRCSVQTAVWKKWAWRYVFIVITVIFENLHFTR